MTTSKSFVAVAAAAAFLMPCAAQQLTMTFLDDSGFNYAGTQFPVLRTGTMSGQLSIQGSAPPVVEYAWAYYHGGHLCYTEKPGTAADPPFRFYFAFKSRDAAILTEDSVTGGTYGIALPYGRGVFPDLPIGTYTLVVWAGIPGQMTYAATGEPNGGVIGQGSSTIVVQHIDTGLFTHDPYDRWCGESISMRALRVDPAPADMFFTVMVPSALGSSSVSQIMIPAGSHASAPFTVQLSDVPTMGEVVLVGPNDTEIRSAWIRANEIFNAELTGDEPVVPPTRTYSWCIQKARPHSLGAGFEVCSDPPPTNPAPPIPAKCIVPLGRFMTLLFPASCSPFAFTTDCEYYIESLMLDKYDVSPSYSAADGVTIETTQVETKLKPPGGEVGGNIARTTTTTLWKTCCKYTRIGAGAKDVVQCRTIE